MAAADCGSYRPAYAYANPITRKCARCPSHGCGSCDEDRCLSCREGFTLGDDGLCAYDLDAYVDRVYWFGTHAVGVLVALAVVLLCVCDDNSEALVKALDHRDQAMPHDVRAVLSGGSGDSGCALPRFPLHLNVHTQNVVAPSL